MADGITLVKAPEEKMSAFNERLRLSCGEVPVTSAQLAVIDGQPVVTLFSESVEAEEEDVQEATEAGETLKEGDLIPAEDPVCVQLCPMHASSLTEATRTQARMETLFKRADGAVTAVLHASGKALVAVIDPESKKEILVSKEVHFAAVVYNPADVEDAGNENPADG